MSTVCEYIMYNSDRKRKEEGKREIGIMTPTKRPSRQSCVAIYSKTSDKE